MPAVSLTRLMLLVALLSIVNVAPVLTTTAGAPVTVELGVSVGVVPTRPATLATRSGIFVPARAFWNVTTGLAAFDTVTFGMPLVTPTLGKASRAAWM